MALPFGPPDYDVAAVGAGHRAFHHQHVVLGVHFDDFQVAHRDLFRSHVSAHAHARQNARRETGCADRPGRAVEHGAMRTFAPAEMMPFDHTCETAAVADPDDIHLFL